MRACVPSCMRGGGDDRVHVHGGGVRQPAHFPADERQNGEDGWGGGVLLH